MRIGLSNFAFMARSVASPTFLWRSSDLDLLLTAFVVDDDAAAVVGLDLGGCSSYLFSRGLLRRS